MKHRKRAGILAAAIALACAMPAAADTLYSFSTGANGNANQSATALFDFASPTSFSLTLTNTGNLTSIASVLDDFSYSINGTFTSLVLNSITAGGFVDCTASTNTTSSCTNNGVTNATGTWSNTVTGQSDLLVAGQGEHPYGIVNNSIFANGSLDGLRNDQHNPYLLGPATFSFTLSGLSAIPTISNVVFSFGTTPDFINGTPNTPPPPPPTVPEPATLLLLAVGCLGLGFLKRNQ